MNYQPSREAVERVGGVRIALLVGISGAGKDTIKHALLKTGEFYNFLSHTTRSPRMNNGAMERDGVDYHFVSKDQISEMLIAGEFIEAKYYAGNVYGTALRGLSEALTSELVAINDVEVQGVNEYKHLFPAVVAIFILPPSYDEWLRRLKHRYASEEEFLAEWPRRRAAAISELAHALEVPYYHFVINDELDRAIEVCTKIALGTDKFTRKDDEARILARDLLELITAN